MPGRHYLCRVCRRTVFASLFVLLGTMLVLPQSARSVDSNLPVILQASNTKATLMSIQFRTLQHGWAVGTGGTILKTIDGGKKWQRVASGTTALLTSVFFVDSSNGWVTGAGGFLGRTTNGGESWLPQAMESQQPLYGVYFTSPRAGWIVGGSGTIFHTTDGGQYWREQVSGTTAALHAAHFLNDQKGTIVGALGTVLSTDDGGSTWTPQETQHAVTLFDVFFTDPTTGWAVGNAGALFQTTDGGSKWVDQTLPCGSTCTRLTDLLKVRFHQPARRLDCRRTRQAVSDDRRRPHLERRAIDRPILAVRPQLSRCDARVGERRKRDHRACATGPLIFHSFYLGSLPSGNRLRA